MIIAYIIVDDPYILDINQINIVKINSVSNNKQIIERFEHKH